MSTLTKEQSARLKERVSDAMSRFTYGSRRERGERTPPAISAARRLVRAWDRGAQAKADRAHRRLVRERDRAINSILFDSAEKAIRAVTKFERREP